jgi:hypothetical protein
MHDTRTGQLVAGVAASGKSADDLDAATPKAVDGLLAELR